MGCLPSYTGTSEAASCMTAVLGLKPKTLLFPQTANGVAHWQVPSLNKIITIFR